ncbi:Hypothetical predicted protein [Drosophila guanche]|uniref:Uncharacterized protein n=2 Tax=Drosophila guanche TaxID=7266 RepID=A0A3B0K2P0_DROGU|nr:Hypothetical predicted protein [Drosophila guanche]
MSGGAVSLLQQEQTQGCDIGAEAESDTFLVVCMAHGVDDNSTNPENGGIIATDSGRASANEFDVVPEEPATALEELPEFTEAVRSSNGPKGEVYEANSLALNETAT